MENKILYRHLLECSPFDENVKHNIDKQFFYRNLLTITKQFKSAKQNLLNALDPNKLEFRKFLLLYGYSGNGKTTFINWFIDIVIGKNSVLSKKYKPIYISPLEDITLPEIGTNLIIETVRHKLIEELRYGELIDDIKINSHIFEQYFEFESWKSFNQLFTLRNENSATYHAYENFIKSITLNEILILFCMNYIIKYYESKRRIIFCFDNLDGIEYEYLTKELWVLFLKLYVQLEKITREYFSDLSDYKKRVGFILVLREANIAKYHAEINDRHVLRDVGREKFLIGLESKNIIEKRYHYALENEVEFQNQDLEAISDVVFNYDNNYLEQVLTPLFNYDIRALTQSLSFIVQTKIVDDLHKKILNFSVLDYKKLYENEKKLNLNISYPKNGSRGILYNTFITFLIKRNLIQFISDDKGDIDITKYGLIRPSRIILTNIYNQSYPNGVNEKEITNYHKIKPKQIGLYDLYRGINLFNYQIFLKRILELFKVRELGSWGHLITIYNKDMSKGFSEEADLFNEIENSDIINYNEREEKINTLNNIKICLNAGGYVYLRYVIKHFEYFNCLSAEEEGLRAKPLFLSTDIIFPDDNSNNCVFEFELIINKVFKKFEDCKRLMSTYLNKVVISDEYPIERLITSNSVFKDKSGKGYLYSSRIITTHIRYLDDFREYIWYSIDAQNKINTHVKNHKNLNLRSMLEIQEFIIDYIEKYNELLSSKDNINDKSLLPVYEIHKSQISLARKQVKYVNFTREKWIRISAREYN